MLHITAGGYAGFNGLGWKIFCSSEVNSGQQIGPNYTFGSSVTDWRGFDTPGNYNKCETRHLYITVTPSTLDSQSPDGSYLAVTFEVIPDGQPIGIYQGANNITYGGTNDTTDLTITCIHTSVMQMTRVVTIDAPTQYIAHANAQLGGDHSHDPVPGAVATFIITYSNSGSATAQNVVIMDKVPPTTEAAHVNAYKGNQAGLPNVTISANQPSAVATWTSYYSTSASPGLGYGNLTGWVTINATLAPSSFATGSGIKYFKWEKSSVPTGEANKTINWGVMIR